MGSNPTWSTIIKREKEWSVINIYAKQGEKVRVALEGCDDSTVVEIEATLEQIEFLNELSVQINKTSAYSCMPKLFIEIIEE